MVQNALTCVSEYIDPCLTDPCDNGGVCNDNGDKTYVCTCDGTGYSGDNCKYTQTK